MHIPADLHGCAWWVHPRGRRLAPATPRCCSARHPLGQSGCCPVWCATPPQSTVGSHEWWCGRFVSFPGPPGCPALRQEMIHPHEASDSWEHSSRLMGTVNSNQGEQQSSPLVNVKTQGHPYTKYINTGIFPQLSAICRYTLGEPRPFQSSGKEVHLGSDAPERCRVCEGVAGKSVAEMNICYSWFTW